MLFTLSPHYRAIERMMTGIPNFRPRGHGIYITRDSPQQLPRERAGCILEAMTHMMQVRQSVSFKARLRKYITETEQFMNYRNENHETVFKETAAKMIDDNDLLAAVYLLTADRRLWWDAEGYVRKYEIRFDELRHRKSSNSAYVLLCAAKDLYLGTQHFSVTDLADSSLITDEMFGLICNAVTIKRFGISVLENNRENKDVTAISEDIAVTA